jgi:SAM-dependent methyltransferase
MARRAFYNLGYRFVRMPWEVGPREELVRLVEFGDLRPCRALDLGCGTGDNAIYLAQHGFDVTGIDFAPSGLAKAARKASRAGVEITLIEDDLTALRHQLGLFDLLVDYSTLDDLAPAQRDAYIDNVVPLAAPAAHFMLWCFEWSPRRVDRWLGLQTMAPGEVQRRFEKHFAVRRIAGTTPQLRKFIPGYAAYLLTRLPEAGS